MARVNPRKLDGKEKMKYLDLLWTSIAGLKEREEVKNFFKDMLTPGESVMLARRILVAKLLLEDKTYDDIQKELRVGLDTIARVHQWLTSGFGGYKNAVMKFNKVLDMRFKKIRSSQKPVVPYTFRWLKRKYPLHFLLFNIFDKLSGKE